MDLFEKVSADIKAAMLARDKVRLEALRGVKKNSWKQKLPRVATALSATMPL